MIDFSVIGEEVGDYLVANSISALLDKRVWKAYPYGGWDEYRDYIAKHGNSPEQIERFEKAGVIMQPKQLEFCAWARLMDSNDAIEEERGSPEIGMGGARGPGKSFVVFAQTALDDCARFPGLRGLYLRKIGKKAKEQLSELVMAILGHVEHTYTDGKVRFPNGSQIIIGYFNYEKDIFNYLGMQYEIIIIEETTTLSEKAYKALRNSNRTSMDMTPRIYNTTNPLGAWHSGYKKRFIDHERKNSGVMNRRRKFIQATVDDNNFVNAEYIGNLEDNTGAELRAYRFGDWDVSAGAYFEQFDYDLHTIEPLKELPRHWPVWASMDYGYQHWNVIYLHTMFDGVIYTFCELAHRKHYVEEIAPEFKTALAKFGRGVHSLETFLAGADIFARRGEAKKTVAQQWEEALGIKIEQAVTGPGSRVAGAHYLSRALGNPGRGIDPTVKITRNCPRLIGTLPSLERNPNNPEDVKKVDIDDDGNGGDDAYDAWRYGLYRGKKSERKATARQWMPR